MLLTDGLAPNERTYSIIVYALLAGLDGTARVHAKSHGTTILASRNLG